MKAICIDDGPYHQYEIGRVYEYKICSGVCDIIGGIAVSEKNFNRFFKKIDENGKTIY